MERLLLEGRTGFWTDSEELVTKGMPVFYNPVMKLNRDLTLLILPSLRNPRIGLPMEASGIRAARILNELVAPGLLEPSLLAINDLSPRAVGFAQRNVGNAIGGFDQSRIIFSTTEASLFLRQSRGFEYIDIDPFGTPNPFLDAAVTRISTGGVLAVTATDTSALAGTYPSATARKYWSVPSRTWLMHEVGLRILIRKVQLVAAQYEKALVPVLSVSTDHYYRVFFRSGRGVKELLAQHKFLHIDEQSMEIAISDSNASAGRSVAGPLWTGRLHDPAVVDGMLAVAQRDPETFRQAAALLQTIRAECAVDKVGFVDLHELASRMKTRPPRKEEVLRRLGQHAAPTHAAGTGIKTDLPIEEIKKLF